MNLIKKIMSTKYKYVFVGLIVALIVFVLGAAIIYGLGDLVEQKQVKYIEFTVTDKYMDEDGQRFYIVKSDKNESFEIANDDVGSKIFNKLEVGNHYHFVTQKMNGESITHIIKVYNETS